jgi:hypothetical protein
MLSYTATVNTANAPLFHAVEDHADARQLPLRDVRDLADADRSADRRGADHSA